MSHAANETALRAEMCEIGRRLYARGLLSATDGNLSVRLGDGLFLCTRSGVSKGFMQPSDIVTADASGAKIAGGGKVSSEFLTHLAAYASRPEINAVVHAHPPVATAWTLAGRDMTAPILPELVMTLGAVPVCDYATPGSPEGAEAVREPVRAHNAVLLARHGALTVGASLEEAWLRMEKLEHAAVVLAHAQALGPLSPLSPGQIARLGAGYDATR